MAHWATEKQMTEMIAILAQVKDIITNPNDHIVIQNNFCATNSATQRVGCILGPLKRQPSGSLSTTALNGLRSIKHRTLVVVHVIKFCRPPPSPRVHCIVTWAMSLCYQGG